MSEYIVSESGERLERRPNMFHWRGRWFSGLVAGNALYDDPADSFAAHVGIQSSLEKGLIKRSAENLPTQKEIDELMRQTCMSPAELEEAKQRLQSYLDAHPKEAADFERWMMAQDAWNFPKRG